MPKIPRTDLDVFPICLGTNVFGWKSSEEESFAVLDAYVEAGGNFIDTADLYGGTETERIIGRWMTDRGNRDELVIATKVGMLDGLDNLKPETIARGAEDSLERLGTDRIDLFYSHIDDSETRLEDTLEAHAELVAAGKVLAIAASNISADRLASSLAVSREHDLPQYVAVQPEYNLMERDFETDGLRDLCRREGLAVFPYFGLARGFLTGKHRPDGSHPDSKRTDGARKYLEGERGPRVLNALDTVAAAYDSSPTTVALAWLRARPGVTAPIVSARVPEQMPDLIAAAGLRLSEDDLALLSGASA